MVPSCLFTAAMRVLLGVVLALALATSPTLVAASFGGCAARGEYRPSFVTVNEPCVAATTPEDESKTVSSAVSCVAEMNGENANTGSTVALSLDSGATLSCLHSIVYLNNGETLTTKTTAGAGLTGYFTTVQTITQPGNSSASAFTGLTLAGGTTITCTSTGAQADVAELYVLTQTDAYFAGGGASVYDKSTTTYFEVVCRSSKNGRDDISWHLSLPDVFHDTSGFYNNFQIGQALSANTAPAGTSLVVTMNTPANSDDAARLFFVAFHSQKDVHPQITCGPISTGYIYVPDDDAPTDGTNRPLLQLWAGPPGHRSRQQCRIVFNDDDTSDALTALVDTTFEIFAYDRLGRKIAVSSIVGNADANTAAGADWAVHQTWDARMPAVYEIPTCDCHKSLSDTAALDGHTFRPYHMDKFTWHCGEKGADALCSPAGVAHSPTRGHMWALIAASIDFHHRCICKTRNERVNAHGKIITHLSMASRHRIFGKEVKYTWTDADTKFYGTVRTKRGVVEPDTYQRVRSSTDAGVDLSNGYELEVVHGFRKDYAFVNSRGLPGIALFDSIHDTTTTVITAEGNKTVVVPVYGTGTIHTDHFKGKKDWQWWLALGLLIVVVLSTGVSGFNAVRSYGLSLKLVEAGVFHVGGSKSSRGDYRQIGTKRSMFSSA